MEPLRGCGLPRRVLETAGSRWEGEGDMAREGDLPKLPTIPIARFMVRSGP